MGICTNDRHPAFLITIDTEGDNLWARRHTVTTRNAHYLPRFQALCERYGFKPTYLTDWDMANCRVFQEFARDVLARGVAEIGMHLHAWNTPPIMPLTNDDYLHHPYLIEYPEHQMREKIQRMTGVLEETFNTKMVSHRAGRWGFDGRYARILAENGYRVDCSVTPHISWQRYPGDPKGRGGSDYTRYPESAYFVNLHDISRPGGSALLEVPVTVIPPHYSVAGRAGRSLLEGSVRLGGRVARRFFPRYAALIPNGRNRRILLGLARAAALQQRDYMEFMLHSSEFMPGGSPTFDTPKSIESLYEDLEALFSLASRFFEGRTLAEYHRQWCDQSDDSMPPAVAATARG